MQQAVKWRLLASNPADAVELPKQSRKEIQMLSTEQTRALLKAAQKDRLGALFALAVTAGPRPSEYWALKWTDLDMRTGTVRVVRSIDWLPGGGWEFTDTKRPRRPPNDQASKPCHSCAANSQGRPGRTKTRRRKSLDGKWAPIYNPYRQSAGRAKRGPAGTRSRPQGFEFAHDLPALRSSTHCRNPRARGWSSAKGSLRDAWSCQCCVYVGWLLPRAPHMQESAAAQVEALLMPPNRKK